MEQAELDRLIGLARTAVNFENTDWGGKKDREQVDGAWRELAAYVVHVAADRASRGSAFELIAAERQRQITAEGWAPEHDAGHTEGQLAMAAAAYATPIDRRKYRFGESTPGIWPWATEDWKPTPTDRIRELVKAGALIVAEIDRLQRSGGRS